MIKRNLVLTVLIGSFICLPLSAVKENTIKVLYAGDSGIVMGPHIIASPFNYESKGAEVHVWCQQVLDALNAEADIEVTYMTTWEAFEKFPETPKELAQYDVVVISDVEWESPSAISLGPLHGRAHGTEPASQHS